MASIALSVVGCIDYLAYGTIFTRVMFLPKIKLDVFFSARKAVDACWEVVTFSPGGTEGYPAQPGLIRPSVCLSVHTCRLGVQRKMA
jgi:hypothetical protein